MHFCADEVDKERPGVGGVLKHQHKTARHVSLTANHFLPHLVMATLRGGAHVPQKPATVDKYFLFAKNL